MDMSELVKDTIRTWTAERPDLDFTAMSTALKLNLLVNKTFQSINLRMLELGLTLGEFDVLATLRRHGKSGVLMPTEIAGFAMISPSGLTNRLTRLEKMGHIDRLSDLMIAGSLSLDSPPKVARLPIWASVSLPLLNRRDGSRGSPRPSSLQ